jgi:hypothetical protein
MNFTRLLMASSLLTAIPAWAVYAPIPEQDQGKEFTVNLRAGVYHDSNIFGAPSGEISSMVYEFAPKVAFNASVSDQTFVSASYKLTYDHFDNRPGEKSLDSHEFEARLDQAFSPVTALHIIDTYNIDRNPQSLLSGVTINSDQSYKRNVLGARYLTNLTPRVGAMAKVMFVNYSYDDNTLAFQLDHDENLYALAVSFDTRPDLKAVAEYRHTDILYAHLGGQKNKHSDFLLGGFDYAVAKTVTASARLGYEWRRRDGQANANDPYVELDVKYNYAEQSFVSAGYVFTFEENSDQLRFTDTRVNRLYLSVQHAITALIVASGSLAYEPSTLQGRSGLPNANETTTRLGLALTYIPVHNWQVTASFDYDSIDSDVPQRGQNRERTGLSANYAF